MFSPSNHIGVPFAAINDLTHTDVMHIEKNVCESLIKFIIGAKDTIKVQRDMEVCSIREHLWLKRDPHKSGKIFKPIASSYVLLLEELKTFLSRLKSLKVPSEYCGSIGGRHIMEKKLGSMKSHDWHMLMQQLMPLGLRGLIQPHVRLALMRLSRVFRIICAKESLGSKRLSSIKR
jgi:hypothetical protein